MPGGDKADLIKRKAKSAEEEADWAAGNAEIEAEIRKNEELDKLWPRMAEPDEEGIDLHPGTPGGGL